MNHLKSFNEKNEELDKSNSEINIKKEVKYCPDCETKLRHDWGGDTDWYGRLDYYWCKCCKEKFVSQDGGELAIAAR